MSKTTTEQYVNICKEITSNVKAKENLFAWTRHLCVERNKLVAIIIKEQKLFAAMTWSVTVPGRFVLEADSVSNELKTLFSVVEQYGEESCITLLDNDEGYVHFDVYSNELSLCFDTAELMQSFIKEYDITKLNFANLDKVTEEAKEKFHSLLKIRADLT